MSEKSWKRIGLISLVVSVLSVVMLIIVVATGWRLDKPIHSPSGPTSGSSSSPPNTSGTSGSLFEGKKISQFSGPRLFTSKSLLELKLQAHHTHESKLLKFQKNFVHCKKWSVVTTISSPTIAVERQSQLENWCLIVVGDKKGPTEYVLHAPNSSQVVFLDTAAQQDLAEVFPMIRLLPWNHFGRKNIGYLFAIAQGAELIYGKNSSKFNNFLIFIY
jgi:hypothetical protein